MATAKKTMTKVPAKKAATKAATSAPVKKAVKAAPGALKALDPVPGPLIPNLRRDGSHGR